MMCSLRRSALAVALLCILCCACGQRLIEKNTLWTTDQYFKDEAVIVSPNVTLAIQGSSASKPLLLKLEGKSGFVVHPGGTLYMENVFVYASIAYQRAAVALHPNASLQAKHATFEMNSTSYTRGETYALDVVRTSDYEQVLLRRNVMWENVTCQGFYTCLRGEGIYAKVMDSLFYNNTSAVSELGQGNFSRNLFWSNDVVFNYGSAGRYNYHVDDSIFGISDKIGSAKSWKSSIFLGLQQDAPSGVATTDCLSFGNKIGWGSGKYTSIQNSTAIANQKSLLVGEVGGRIDRVNLIKAAEIQLELRTSAPLTVNSSIYWGPGLHNVKTIQAKIKDARQGGSSGFVTIESFAKKPFRHELLSRLVQGHKKHWFGKASSQHPEPLWLLWEQYAQATNHSEFSHSTVSKAVSDWLLHDGGITASYMPPAPSPNTGSSMDDWIKPPFGSTTQSRDSTCSSLERRLFAASLILNLVLLLGIYCYCKKGNSSKLARSNYKAVKAASEDGVTIMDCSDSDDVTLPEVELT